MNRFAEQGPGLAAGIGSGTGMGRCGLNTMGNLPEDCCVLLLLNIYTVHGIHHARMSLLVI